MNTKLSDLNIIRLQPEATRKEDKEMTKRDAINRVKELMESGKDPSVVFDEYLKHVNTLLHNIENREQKKLIFCSRFSMPDLCSVYPWTETYSWVC